MSPQVTAALITSGAALVVALLGIAGAIAAQTVSTRRAFQNSLDLFERQRRAEQEERQEQARREDAFRFAEQRTSLYARYARSARDLFSARLDVDEATQKCSEHFRQSGGNTPGHSQMAEDSRVMRSLDNAFAEWVRLRVELDVTWHELRLLSSPEVREAAANLSRSACRLPDLAGLPDPDEVIPDEVTAYMRQGTPEPASLPEYESAQDRFFETAQRELGVQPIQPSLDPGSDQASSP